MNGAKGPLTAEDPEGEDGWDRQAAGNLDGPAYLRELQGEPEQAVVLKGEDEGEVDDEEYEQRALNQVRDQTKPCLAVALLL